MEGRFSSGNQAEESAYELLQNKHVIGFMQAAT
jgi:hypothetical protein